MLASSPDPRDPRAVETLQRLIRIPTVADPDPERTDAGPFEEFLSAFAECFPRLCATLERTTVDRHGMLWRWPGRGPGDPVVLMAHLDVVPVDDTDPWTHPAWAGEIVDGEIWGRGTLDDKGQLVAVAEAVERLLEDGFTPARDVWLSFGCNEEVSGTSAGLAVEHLREHAVRPWFVLDEGGAVASEAFPGVKPPLAVVGVTEKGTTTLRLTVEGRGGHSSTPARMDTTARLARAILRIDRSPFAASVPAPTRELFRRIGPHLPLPLRALAARADRLAPALTRALVAAGPETAAMTRTTAVVTTLQGSPAHNVIAQRATASVNLRVMLGDTVAGVTEHVRRAVKDRKVHIEVVEAGEPSPLSPVDDDAFRLLETVIGEVFPDAVATPYVMMAATDSRFFHGICPRVYRFAPFRMSKAQREAIHSYDERLGVADLADGVRWYRRLIEELPG